MMPVKQFFGVPQKHAMFMMVLVILGLSLVVNSSYRGIVHDEGLGHFAETALRIVNHQPIYSPQESKIAARLLYTVSIALAYKLVGINLLALHLFPYLLNLISPLLFFSVLYRYYQHVWWGLAGAVLWIASPVNIVFLNMQYNSPLFVFFVLILVLVLEKCLENPKWLLLFGVVTALLLLTRLEDGIIFTGLLYGVYVLKQWRRGISWRWLFLSVGACVFTYAIFLAAWRIPILYLTDYLPIVFARQAEYGAEFSFYELTLRGFRNVIRWYLCGKVGAPVLAILALFGIVAHLKQRHGDPLVLLLPYGFFILFIYNARFDIANLANLPFLNPGFLWLVVSGIRAATQYCARRFRRLSAARPTLIQVASGLLIVSVLVGFFINTTLSFVTIIEDALPASSFWRIVRTNPLLPGHPDYREVYVPLNRVETFPIKARWALREELIKAVRGVYRGWYLNSIGHYAFKHDLPNQASLQADFIYRDNYETPDQWHRDRHHVDNETTLWNAERPGQIGVFLRGKSGSFIYKFDIPEPIDDVTLSDIHTQWDVGDVTKLWTSTDGEHWTLRHNNFNLHYTKDYYYQFFDHDFEGQRSIWIKYEFQAGTKTRIADDPRGASLQSFLLTVNYQKEK